jgi:hypothetical protein
LCCTMITDCSEKFASSRVMHEKLVCLLDFILRPSLECISPLCCLNINFVTVMVLNVEMICVFCSAESLVLFIVVW